MISITITWLQRLFSCEFHVLGKANTTDPMGASLTIQFSWIFWQGRTAGNFFCQCSQLPSAHLRQHTAHLSAEWHPTPLKPQTRSRKHAVPCHVCPNSFKQQVCGAVVVIDCCHA